MYDFIYNLYYIFSFKHTVKNTKNHQRVAFLKSPKKRSNSSIRLLSLSKLLNLGMLLPDPMF